MIGAYMVLIMILGIVALASLCLKNRKTELAVAIIIAAAIGSLVAGMGLRIRELVEGPFGYFDSVLVVITGMIFLMMLMDNGVLEIIFERIVMKKRKSILQAILLLLLVALPGIFTGTATASILTTGTLVGTYLLKKGVEKSRVVEFIAMGSLIGMLMPPICLPAMIIVVSRSGSFPASFEGYAIPLLIISLPTFILYAKIASKWIGGLEVEKSSINEGSFKYFIPLIIVGLLLFAHNFMYSIMPFLGYPLIFAIGTIFAIFLSPNKVKILNSTGNAVNLIAPVIAITFSIGSALEIFTLTGVSGRLATAFYTVNPATLGLVSILLVLLFGMLIGGSFAVLTGTLCSYVIGAVVWGGNEMSLAAISAALCVAIFLPIRGGIVSDTVAAIGLEETDTKKIVAGAIIPISLILVISVIYALAYNNLKFLLI